MHATVVATVVHWDSSFWFDFSPFFVFPTDKVTINPSAGHRLVYFAVDTTSSAKMSQLTRTHILTRAYWGASADALTHTCGLQPDDGSARRTDMCGYDMELMHADTVIVSQGFHLQPPYSCDSLKTQTEPTDHKRSQNQ